MERKMLEMICERQRTQEPTALVTIVATRGSTPRKAGSKMLIFPDGKSLGTIGGGCGEAEVKRQVLTAFDEQQSQMYTVSMSNDFAAEEGMVCGGSMEVFIQIL